MEDKLERASRVTTLLADLGPLPEVVECSSETTWKLFQELQETVDPQVTPSPSSLALLDAAVWAPRRNSLTVERVMTEARRYNRVCPMGPQWDRLHALLEESTQAEAPAPISGADLVRTSSLTKRIRVRDQVEWAAERGVLHIVHAFFKGLREDQWVHMD